MKPIKTRSSAKNIKILDKTIILSQRIKNGVVLANNKTEETQNPQSGSHTDYATSSVKDKAQSAVSESVSVLRNPRKKAIQNLNRAKNHFQEVRRQSSKVRQRAAGNAQKTANATKTNAESLIKTADNAGETAQKAKSAVKDAKQTLKEVRQSGRQTLREVKTRTRYETRAKSTNMPIQNALNNGNPVINNNINVYSANPAQNTTPSKPPTSNSINAANPKPIADTGKFTQTLTKTAKTAEPTKKTVKAAAKSTVKTAKKSVKTAEKTAKTAVKTARTTAKTAQKTAKATAKAAKAAAQTAKAAAKVAVQAAKAAAKSVVALVKMTIAAIKGLAAAIAAGGWIAVMIILIICMVGLILGSVFGVFYSGENSGSGQTINGVIAEIDAEYQAQIDALIGGNAHDLLDMSGARAGWKDVLAVYSVRTTTDPDNPLEVATVDEAKANILYTIFWEMNAITYSLDMVEVAEDVPDDDGLPTGEAELVTQTVLRIVVTHKTPEETAAQYHFNAGQTALLDELLKPEYVSLWNALLYGVTSIGDGSIVEIAASQIGNIGGELYRRWYGLSAKVDWCAIFVSWCAEQAGYIDAAVILKFAYCPYGIQWFKDRGQWREPGYTPAPGDLIFFDWGNDGGSDHVGIVERIENGTVHTIEGNTSDSVARRSYALDSLKICGYGSPAY